MKIKSFSIIDVKNREAQSFDFKSGTNLIVSNTNTQGKSSLLKSLYYTLGFDVRQFPSSWNTNDMYFEVTVEIYGVKHTIIRHKNIFKVSDIEGALNVKEYSEWLQIKLNTRMKLSHKQTKNLINAYSSALLLPFYIDQDDSWDGAMYKNVSDTLNQYAQIPKDVFKNTFSLSDTDIMELEILRNNLIREKNAIDFTIISLKEVLEEYREKNKDCPKVSQIDKEILNEEIQRYLSMLNELNRQMTKFKVNLLKKQEQLDLQKQELSELNELLKMNEKRYKSIKSECKYCHSKLTTEQSLTRIDLSDNHVEISLFREVIEKDINRLTEEMDDFKNKKSNVESKIDEINSRIAKSKELITIDDYVKASAKNEASNELESVIDKQIISWNRVDSNIKSIRKQINMLKKEKLQLTEVIKKDYDFFVSEIKKTMTDIDLNELEFLEFKKIPGSGMDKNKKYLAYYLVYFSLLRKYSSYMVPFCMDSFIKNEITEDTSQLMFRAIEKHFFDNDNQSFFSIVKPNLKHFENMKQYNTIEVNGKLLSNQKYDEVSLKFDIRS